MIRHTLAAAGALVLSAALTMAAAVGLGGRGDGPAPAPIHVTALDRVGSSSVAGLAAALQDRLRANPRDHRAWSSLGLAYVEAARVSADPTYYPRADRALDRAEGIAPGDDLMLTGRATLAAARHDFTGSLRLANRALATNPASAQAHAVRSDALTELGRYDEARTAATRADHLRPGTSTFARLSYAAELRGDLAEARRLMARAQQASTGAADYAFAALHLGELARSAGDRRGAARHYAAALRADPDNASARAGQARLALARGDMRAAERDYLTVVRRLPLPEYVVELGELYLATGRADDAAEQFRVAEALAALARSNGVATDLEEALFEADHGSPDKSLTAASDEWGRRHTIHTADAMAWALHKTGDDRAALRFARRATALGTRDARLLFHRGAVEAALGLPGPAARHLRAALHIDAGASPLREREARHLLAELAELEGIR